MGGAVTKDQDIIHTQYLDLVYSQSRTLYDLIPQAPRPSTDPTTPLSETPVDGVVGSIHPSLAANISKKHISSNTTPSAHMVSTEVNAIQITQTFDYKNKGKGKNKNPGNQKDNPKATTPENNNKGKRKDKYLFLLCGGDHFIKECPCCE